MSVIYRTSDSEAVRRARPLSQVVAIGGGSGLPVVLAGLRRSLPVDCGITAVVTAADDGGSSGTLREQYDVLPPGDIRNCLLALSRVAPEVSAALQYRFDGLPGPGHPVGNLLLAALEMVTPDEVTAIRLAAGLLRVEDVILPATTTRVQLVAELADGREVRGESTIPRSAAPIARLRVDPPGARAAHDVLRALERADAIILGPGSLYTSILAALVVPGILETVLATPATRIFVCNLMTEPGETDGYGVAAHVAALAAHGLPPEALYYVVVNTARIPAKALARHSVDGTVQDSRQKDQAHDPRGARDPRHVVRRLPRRRDRHHRQERLGQVDAAAGDRGAAAAGARHRLHDLRRVAPRRQRGADGGPHRRAERRARLPRDGHAQTILHVESD